MTDEREELENLIAKAARDLGERFDSVQIVAVSDNPRESGCAMSFTSGTGSYYERQAAVREWLIRQEEYVREYARLQQRGGHG